MTAVQQGRPPTLVEALAALLAEHARGEALQRAVERWYNAALPGDKQRPCDAALRKAYERLRWR